MFYQFLFIVMNGISFKRLNLFYFQLDEQSIVHAHCENHAVLSRNVYRFIRQLLLCNCCVINLISHLLGHMIEGGQRVTSSEYDLTKHEEYIRSKYSQLSQKFKLIRGDAYNSLDSNVSLWR